MKPEELAKLVATIVVLAVVLSLFVILVTLVAATVHNLWFYLT